MPRGQPDWGAQAQKTTVGSMADNAELAVRLGSIVTFDRRGDVVWFDDFEAPLLKWHPVATAPGEDAILSTATAFSGIQSALINVPAGGIAESYIERFFPLIRLGRVGFEIWVTGRSKAPGYIMLRAHIFDGATPIQVSVVLDTIAKTVFIYTPAGLVPIATNVFTTVTGFYFLPLKLVVDMDTDLYTRLLVGPREYDISAHAAEALPASADQYIRLFVYVIGEATIDKYAYLDNFILTQNEP